MFFCGAIKLTGNIPRSRFQVHGSILCSSAEQFNLQVTFLDPGSMFMVLSYVLLRILVTEFWFQVPGTWFQVPGSRFLAPGFWFQVTCSWLQVHCYRFLSIYRFLVKGSWLKVPGSRFLILGSRFLVPGYRFLVQGYRFLVTNSFQDPIVSYRFEL